MSKLVEGHGKSRVEEVIDLFVSLDEELKSLSSEVDKWGSNLVDQARKLGSQIRQRVLEKAREEGEKFLKEQRQIAEREAQRISMEGKERSKRMLEKMESAKDKVVEEVLKLVLPD